MSDSSEAQLVALTQRLLDAIDAQDWSTYAELCDATLTSFEPECPGSLIEGLRFHRFYFELPTGRRKQQSTVSSPRVRVMGDVAVVAYVRAVQRADESGLPVSAVFEETRVWQRQGDRWKHVHFHRSRPAHGG